MQKDGYGNLFRMSRKIHYANTFVFEHWLNIFVLFCRYFLILSLLLLLSCLIYQRTSWYHIRLWNPSKSLFLWFITQSIDYFDLFALRHEHLNILFILYPIQIHLRLNWIRNWIIFFIDLKWFEILIMMHLIFLWNA